MDVPADTGYFPFTDGLSRTVAVVEGGGKGQTCADAFISTLCFGLYSVAVIRGHAGKVRRRIANGEGVGARLGQAWTGQAVGKEIVDATRRDSQPAEDRSA